MHSTGEKKPTTQAGHAAYDSSNKTSFTCFVPELPSTRVLVRCPHRPEWATKEHAPEFSKPVGTQSVFHPRSRPGTRTRKAATLAFPRGPGRWKTG